MGILAGFPLAINCCFLLALGMVEVEGKTPISAAFVWSCCLIKMIGDKLGLIFNNKYLLLTIMLSELVKEVKQGIGVGSPR